MWKRAYTYSPPEPSAQEQDYLLVQETLQGNQDAYNTLYTESFSFVVSAIKKFDYQHFFSPCDYEDITNEAFTKCYEHLERFQMMGRFRNWVLGHAKNIMRNRRRRQLTEQRNQALFKSALDSQLRYLDPLFILIQSERNQYLWESFYLLSLPEQIILYNHLFFSTPFRILAKELQLTHRQVSQSYRTALFKVRWHYCRLYRQTPGEFSEI